MAWCWTFFVTLGAGERFITSVGSFMSLYGLIVNICSHTGRNWMIYNRSGFFHVSCHHEADHFCHTGNSWMVYHQCGFFHVSLNGLTLNIWSHTRSNWMVFQWCELFHVSLHCLMLRNGSNWRVYHRSGFFLVQVQNWFVCFAFHVENWTDILIF